MNTLIFFVTGIAVGVFADKIYHTFMGGSKHPQGSGEEVTEMEVEAVAVSEENVPAEKETNTEDESAETEDNRDDLSLLKGVGPKLAQALDEIGIYNYKQLSSSPADTLLERLRETGGRFSLRVISSVVERAGQTAGEQ